MTDVVEDSLENLIDYCLNVSNKDHYIVVSSTQYPGYGGAATNAYKIIKYLRSKKYNVVGIFFHKKNIICDPENIGGIYVYDYYNFDKDIIYNDAIKYLKNKPTLCLAKNYRAPHICKTIFNCFTVYLVSGIAHTSIFYNKNTALEILNDSFIIPHNHIVSEEIKCNNECDLIVLNSLLSKKIFEKIYDCYKHKIYKYILHTSNLITDDDSTIKIVSNGFGKKIYDILICCSDLERPQKNNLFLLDILIDNQFDKYTKCIVGSNYSKFINIKNSICTGLLNPKETCDIMRKSKILLFPSLFDANPNTVFEAVNYGCIPLITRNIGFSEKYPNDQVCESFCVDEWKQKIIYLLNNFIKKV
jgi:glycosyltransferase involved in cell wall biosynthesis